MRPAPPDPPSLAGLLWEGMRGGVGWDVGANGGQSLPFLLDCCERVHAFEPCVEAVTMLTSAWPAGQRLVVHPVAVSSCDGQVTLAALPAQLATGQLVTPGTHGMEWDPGAGWEKAPNRVVPCRSVDSLARELGVPDVVKVDTEGHEGHVLAGAATVLRGGRTDWLIEFHTPALWETCCQVLREFGYRVQTVRHPHYAPGSPMWHQHGWLRAHAPRNGATIE